MLVVLTLNCIGFIGTFLYFNFNGIHEFKIKEPSVTSGLVGKTFTNDIPLVYIENMPNAFGGVKGFYTNNSEYNKSSTRNEFKESLVSHLATYRLEGLSKACCWLAVKYDLQRYYQPKLKKLRVLYIPSSRNFKVIDEYQIYHYQVGQLPFGENSAHYLLIVDSFGNMSEIREIEFRENFVDIPVDHLDSINVEEIENIMAEIKKDNSIGISFCPAQDKQNTEDVLNTSNHLHNFINQFELEGEVSFIVATSPSCTDEHHLYFETPEAFMTAYYFFPESVKDLNGEWEILK